MICLRCPLVVISMSFGPRFVSTYPSKGSSPKCSTLACFVGSPPQKGHRFGAVSVVPHSSHFVACILTPLRFGDVLHDALRWLRGYDAEGGPCAGFLERDDAWPDHHRLKLAVLLYVSRKVGGTRQAPGSVIIERERDSQHLVLVAGDSGRYFRRSGGALG